MGMNCIDVSSYQGAINWAKVKEAGIKYAILRSVVKGLDTDSQFEANMKNARAAGVQLGVYLYTYAGDAAYAKKEAKALLKLLAGRPLELGVFYDMETSGLRTASAATVQAVASAFRAEIVAAGYTCGVYCDASFYGTNNHFKGWDPDCEFWVASYGNNNGQQHSIPKIDHHLIAHQYSDKGRVSGVSGDCDVDNWYGPATAAPAVPAAPEKKTVAQLAQEVIDGKWGNGAERKARLIAAGYDYDAVQDAVNKKLKPAGKTVEQLAREVIAGDWGNGADRKARLTAAGYDYGTVQAAVNRMI